MSDSDHFFFFASRVENGVAYLDSEEARHARSVLRLDGGDAILVTDGSGFIHNCRLRPAVADVTECDIVSSRRISKPACTLNLFVGIGDRDRFEDLAENCAALGVDRLFPLVCRFSQKPWWNSWEKHKQRIDKKLIAGIKQAQNAWLPQLSAPRSFPEALMTAKTSYILLADSSGASILQYIERIKNSATLSLFVGPPGGFSLEEIEGLASAGATFVSLSSQRLRTELAAITLCSVVKMVL